MIHGHSSGGNPPAFFPCAETSRRQLEPIPIPKSPPLPLGEGWGEGKPSSESIGKTNSDSSHPHLRPLSRRMGGERLWDRLLDQPHHQIVCSVRTCRNPKTPIDKKECKENTGHKSEEKIKQLEGFSIRTDMVGQRKHETA